MQVLKIGTNCYDISDADETGILIDGCDYYRAFYRSAKMARRYILVSGWQFDSDVQLIRKEDAAEGEKVGLLAFLNSLCEKNKDLHIYILAWSFNAVYGIDREWFQKWYFNWTTNDRLKFCFDACHCFGASHHQKFAVIDGATAFVGGLDLCSGRWDDRDHCADNRNRVNTDQSTYPPFHDIQSYHSGPVAKKLAELFTERWKLVCCEELKLAQVSEKPAIDFPGRCPVLSNRVAVSRTQAKTDDGKQDSIQEIRRLFEDAIASAERLIYIENQYFSSDALLRALSKRMKAKERSQLDIVLVLARDTTAFVEKISIGRMQAKVISCLKELAAANGHRLGVYYPACLAADGQEVPIYIHSKLFLVDDRFLSIGSANMNNRSMSLDTEVNVTWEASAKETGLIRSIKNLRIDLLAEHIGLRATDEVSSLGQTEELVNHLNALADNTQYRLRRHPSLDEDPAEFALLNSILPDGWPFDAVEPAPERIIYENSSEGSLGFFAAGIASLKNILNRPEGPPTEQTPSR